MSFSRALPALRFSAIGLAALLLSAAPAYAQTTPTVTIQSLVPGTSVNQGSTLTFSTVTTGLTNPTITLSDSFANSSIGIAIVTGSGSVSWTPLAQDVGAHTITVTAMDASGQSATASQAITVNPPPSVAIQALSPGAAVVARQAVTFTTVPTSFTNPVFSVGDAFSGSTISNGNINSAGFFSWTPLPSDIGLHTITIYATDAAGDSAHATQQLTVTSASLSVASTTPGTTVAAGTTLSIALASSGFTNPAYTVRDTENSVTVATASIPSSGVFTWTPIPADVGPHTLLFFATDSTGQTANTSILITVSPPAAATSTVSAAAPAPAAVPASAAAAFLSNLSVGSSGSDVTELQAILKQQGFFSGAPTGYFGVQTEAAVKAFQRAHSIDAVGAVGPSTRAVLNALPASSAAPAAASLSAAPASTAAGYVFSKFLGLGSSGAEVSALQNKLASLGLYAGPVTGYYGALTQAAVKKFQAAHGLDTFGYVGPGTRAALNGQ